MAELGKLEEKELSRQTNQTFPQVSKGKYFVMNITE